MSDVPQIKNLFDVKDRVVLVTGGAKGIGKMISYGYVMSGATVYITSRDAKACSAFEKELNQLGPGKAIAIPADLQKVSEVERLVAEFAKREKVLHVLVNNAGANWGAPLEEYPDQAFTKVMNLNLQRVFTLTQKLVPYLLPKDGGEDGPWENPGRIINIGSVDGIRIPALETYAYSASKAGLHQLSRVLANQLGRRGVTSNVIAPGPFESKMMAATLEAGREAIVSGIPLARIGSPEDLIGMCLFLSSRAGAYVNGAVITCDGGAVCSAKL